VQGRGDDRPSRVSQLAEQPGTLGGDDGMHPERGHGQRHGAGILEESEREEGRRGDRGVGIRPQCANPGEMTARTDASDRERSRCSGPGLVRTKQGIEKFRLVAPGVLDAQQPGVPQDSRVGRRIARTDRGRRAGEDAREATAQRPAQP
jgi:hypothetical protein